MAAVVERDDAAPGARQRRHPCRIDPVHFLGRSEAVHQHDRPTFALVEISDLDVAVLETCHGPGFYTGVVMAAKRRRRTFLRQFSTRWVPRSVALLSAEINMKAVNSAPSIHRPRSKVASVSAIAPRPTTFRIARVLPPSFSASFATCAISRGVSAI